MVRIVLLCLVALVAAAPAAGAAVPKAPPGLKLYKPPANLKSYKPGDLIWARKVERPLPQASRTWTLLYRSTSLRGKAIGVSGFVMLPKGKPPKRGWPVISWAHGTTGIADSCAPSRDPKGPYTAYAAPQFGAWLRAGYAIANTDYEGLGTPGVHPYLVGRSEGRGVVDIVRASRQLDGRLARRYAIAGHSQGGHAALFAAALAPKRASELRLQGVAAFAPASHLDLISRTLPNFTSPSGLSGLAALVLRGVSSVYPQIEPGQIASDRALGLLPQVDKVCLGELNAASSFGGIAPADLVRPGADLEPLNMRLAQQNPNLKISAPILLAQGLTDTTVLPPLTDQLDGELRTRRNKVRYLTYPNVDHVGIVGAADRATRKFFKTVLAIARAAPANAGRVKRCEGIGDTITKLRAKGQPCDTARTLAAKWVETAASSGGHVARLEGFRCVRRNPPGPGRAVRCTKRDGAVLAAFRYRLR
jgi:pimeloyl-ACP methyl ester carboxylesterase